MAIRVNLHGFDIESFRDQIYALVHEKLYNYFFEEFGKSARKFTKDFGNKTDGYRADPRAIEGGYINQNYFWYGKYDSGMKGKEVILRVKNAQPYFTLMSDPLRGSSKKYGVEGRTIPYKSGDEARYLYEGHLGMIKPNQHSELPAKALMWYEGGRKRFAYSTARNQVRSYKFMDAIQDSYKEAITDSLER